MTIRQKYEAMSEPIENVCSHTCLYCEDICCKRATIWFDLKDLLYIYFGLNRFPVSQMIKKKGGTQEKACCHFSEKGCTLERIDRPFVCIWYFCPAQTKHMLFHHEKIKKTIDQGLNEIKVLRHKMEEEFIRISSSE